MTDAKPELSHEPLELVPPGEQISETVARLLHDLNQPLTALTNFLAAAQIGLEHAAPPEALAGLIDDANAQGARARAIVRQLRHHLAH